MHFFAHTTLIIAFSCALAGAIIAIFQLWTGRRKLLPWVECCQLAVLGSSTIASFILYRALVTRDFTFSYVAEYTDLTLPLFYTVTAFWAGQSGSLLFWLWTIALLGTAFWATSSYRSLSPATRLYFWVFYLGVTSFLLLLLTSYTSPFQKILPHPTDGNGLNPLLQNPAMIFHPPLLFLGYAGFTIPACLALAQLLTNRGCLVTIASPASPKQLNLAIGLEPHWIVISRNFTLLAWSLLTAGILLGAWWAYMELGWGGYWAWDPVENASLIPWLVSTAALHTSVLESRHGELPRTNTLLVVLTLITSFFATYLVRSGIVDSLHAFGNDGFGDVLLIGILASLALSIWIIHTYPPSPGRSLSGIISRNGFLLLTVWILLALSLVITLATLWPVISKTWSSHRIGLNANFYNQVCLPFFTLLTGVLAVCPWLSWKSGFTDRRGVIYIAGAFLGVLGALWIIGVHKPSAAFSAAAATACLASIIVVLATDSSVRQTRHTWTAYGVHAGMALIVIGVAFSGPYQSSTEARLQPGQSLKIAGYQVTYTTLHDGGTQAMTFIKADLRVTRNNRELGLLTPQLRFYHNLHNSSAKVSVIWSLGDELYATLLATDRDHSVIVKININPLVNWIWIGGILMALFSLLGMTYRKIATKETTV